MHTVAGSKQADEGCDLSAVTFLAAAVGVRQVGGLWVEAGTKSTRRLMYQVKKCMAKGIPDATWEKISFAHDFASPPAFLTSIQTLNNENGLPEKNSEPWFTGRDATRRNTTRRSPLSAEVSLEMAETSEHGGAQVNQDEVVGYIAIEYGVATLQSSTGAQVTMAAVMSGRTIYGWETGSYDVALGTDLSVAAPLAVASQFSPGLPRVSSKPKRPLSQFESCADSSLKFEPKEFQTWVVVQECG
eukprot:s2435_g9.t1